jgi:glycosyltransferase involved in cell wall biosynthesis
MLSVILPIRNRSGVRLENCLRSLRWQDLPASKVEIVISDFGSTPEHRASLAPLAERYAARVVTTRTDEIWNRSRALNTGIRAATQHYVLCTDVDIIFSPDFLATAVAEQHQAADQALVVCRCLDLPSSVPEQIWEQADYPWLLSNGLERNKLGTGACQMAPRTFFHRLRGYDERYVFWGMEDNDFRFRSRRSGMPERWMHHRTSMLHQWHPSDDGRRPVLKFLNDARFHMTKYVRVKNRSGWGGVRD